MSTNSAEKINKSVINFTTVATIGIPSKIIYEDEMGRKTITIKPESALIIIKDLISLQREL